ncbi:DNA-directed RNA polymerase I subunit rpa49 [Vanrija albida]|uniref:DNA-directed RNA polymerase I subunit rpa49 n=1 Tax=Vanrija albida TaxID=181172 RepID=A0ABR3Q949_9TREE
MASSSQDQTKKSKKRKSMASNGVASNVSVVVAESSTGVGPAFVNFPSVRPSSKTPFQIYSRDPSATTADITKQRTLIAGETEDVEYFSTNRDYNTGGEGSDCQYVPALYDPSSKTLHVHPSTPLYLLAHRVKRMREAPLLSTGPSAEAIQWKAKRNDLGEAFGTRKAKSQIKAEERNKVDINAMQGVRGDLMKSIGGKEAKEEGPVPPSELIPVPNLETSNPAEVYSREAIIPQAEWSAINVTPITQATDDRGRSAALPYRRSRWIEDKLRVAVNAPSSTRKNSLRMLYYLACLLQFYSFAGQLSKTSRSELPAKFPGVPQQVLNGLLTRFAEPQGKQYTVTEKTKTKLLAWICVCYLACDGWSVDISRVARDLSLTPAKITDMFKSLGCSADLASPAEREKLGVSQADAAKLRRAVLKAPVKFPKIKRRGPTKR